MPMRGPILSCAAVLGLGACAGPQPGALQQEASRFYPPKPQTPRAVALGTLRGAPPPSATEARLSVFLFGVEPIPPLTIADPAGLATHGDSVWICDNALNTVFRWDAEDDRVVEEQFDPPLERPFAVDIAANGERLICDHHGVRRISTDGRALCAYTLSEGKYKPGGVLAVGETIWVTNLALNRIEVFSAVGGQHLRSIGEWGRGPGQFTLPRNLARTPDGNVCVVDMLNNRVQVLAPDGRWLRDIGRPGDSVGSFGRPKDVAVGPDGTIFVTDAFSQRVQAFAVDGTPLLAFGDPGSGIGELTVPSGVAISAKAPRTAYPLPPDDEAAYYVLVAEQLNAPGIRVYAWLRSSPGGETETSPSAAMGEGRHQPRSWPGPNPHWKPASCNACHQMEGERARPILLADSDALCLSCHDGTKAPADPHPIGRKATTELIATPPDWPTVQGAIGCLTCHDIQQHCSLAAERPVVNSILLRGYDPQRPLEYCANCHHSDVGGRFSPHQQRDATGRIREDACLFCHTKRPDVPADGRRRFEPHLRVESSELCLNCHTRHWDLSPLGHVDRPVTSRIRNWMLVRELSLTQDAPPEELAKLAEKSARQPARLPLGHDKVTCYTCHNPHYTGLFPPDSELGALATDPQDRRSALRTNWIDLCSECHHH
jgi:predicted CXXCH cytochrome family protein